MINRILKYYDKFFYVTVYCFLKYYDNFKTAFTKILLENKTLIF